MNVAFFAQAPFISGAERCLQLLLSNIEETSIKPYLFVPPRSPMIDWAKKNDIPVIILPLLVNKLGYAKQRAVQLAILYYLLRHKISVIHSNQLWTLKIIPSVVTWLNIKVVCHLRDSIEQGAQWWFSNSTDAVICISNNIEHQFRGEFPQYNGKIFKLIDPIAKPKTIACQNSHGLVFGFIGQLRPEKGLREFILALSSVKSEVPWKLVIAGVDTTKEQNYRKALEDIIDRESLTNHVEWLGFVSDLDDYYAAIDIAVTPSFDEPLGLIPLEAAIRRKPTLATKVGGLKENIFHGETGFLYSPDYSDFDEVISQVFQYKDLSELGRKAENSLDPMVDLGRNLKRLESVFHSL